MFSSKHLRFISLREGSWRKMVWRTGEVSKHSVSRWCNNYNIINVWAPTWRQSWLFPFLKYSKPILLTRDQQYFVQLAFDSAVKSAEQLQRRLFSISSEWLNHKHVTDAPNFDTSTYQWNRETFEIIFIKVQICMQVHIVVIVSSCSIFFYLRAKLKECAFCESLISW